MPKKLLKPWAPKLEKLQNITWIEKALYDLTKNNINMQEYFFMYYLQKLVLTNHFYPHVEAQLKGYTDHGPAHIIRMLKLYEKIFKNNIPVPTTEEIENDAQLNIYEIYVLLCATIWHDVGNLYGRNKHDKNIRKVVKIQKEQFFYDDELKEYILQIAEAHAVLDGVKLHIPDEITTYSGKQINLHFLGSVLKLADVMDDSETRVDKIFYKTVKGNNKHISKKQEIYWETSLRITRIEPKPDEFKIEVDIHIKKDELFIQYPKNRRKFALIDEILFKIDNINEERKQYMKYVKKHIEFKKIFVNIIIKNHKHKVVQYVFDDKKGYFDFWKKWPSLNPSKKIRNYKLQKR